MQVGAFASFMTPVSTHDAMWNLARDVDNAGLDSLWLGEHVMVFDEMAHPYPGSPDGKLPIPRGFGIPDQVATIGFLAGAAKNLRFGTGISLISQRNPIYTAKEFATLDWITQGRIDLGVGVGWCKEEVEACGYGWENRGKRTDEALELITRLWTEDEVTLNGTYHNVTGAQMYPKTVQKPHLPLIIGGYSKAALQRTARYGQGWLGFGLTPEMTTPMLAALEQALQAENRSLADIEIIMMPGVDDEAAAHAFAELGVDRLVPIIPTDAVAAPAERIRHLEALAKTFG